MPKMSPTQRSMKLLREQGYAVYRAEHWNHFAKVKQDAFGFIDIIALDPMRQRIIGVQATAAYHGAERKQKIIGKPEAKAWLMAGGVIEVHEWKIAKRATIRIIGVELGEFPRK